MVQSYKQKHTVADHYDAIFIGTGIGCLATAACLAKEGQKVLLLERHYTAGGYTHVFKRRGYEWDVGIHYIGEVTREKAVLRKLFDYVTDGALQWADMGEVYDRVVIGEKTYDFKKGVQNWKDQLKGYFPEEEKAIDTYVDLLFQVSKDSRSYFAEKASPKLVQQLMGGRMRKAYLKYANRSTLSVLQELTSNAELIKVLTAQYGDYGLPPGQSSFVMHASVAKHYLQGGAFPIGGSSRIVETVDPVIEAAGGTILTNAEVKQVLLSDGRATGVELADGQVYTADKVVSGTGIINTYTKLLPAVVAQKHNLPSQLDKVTPSVAHVCLYIGLNGSPDALQLPKANYWIYPDDLDHDGCVERYANDLDAPFPVVYISFPAAKDPSWSERYPGKSTIDIITMMPYDMFEAWGDTRWKKRGEDYETLKEKFAQRLLEHLYEQEPQLRGKVDCYELSSPITTRHFMNYERGELYGIDHDPQRYQNRFLQPRTPIKNFYLTGQDIVTAGVGGALF
ncbi:MAG TPA: FAD-dependent oxidoreductase, partial [Cytophagales bacterium]|nr:FAD-dependent oxidoreductase [Cytophagales bacterium]